MCIAIVKPCGVEMPTKDILQTCWNNNPDGAGFCYNDGKKVVIHKGYMKFNDFYKELTACSKLYDLRTKDVAIHFRISTSGGVKPQNTHPFCVSTHMKNLTQLYCKCNSAFLHNGIISGYGTKDYSDTMEYVTNVIANIKDLEHSRELINNLAAEKNSRFAVLTHDNFILGGDWTKDGGIYYSNTTYKPRAYVRADYSKYFSKTSTCDFCWQTFDKSFVHKYWDKTSGMLLNLCDDCYNYYNGLADKYNK